MSRLANFPEYLKRVEAKWGQKLARRFDRERYVASKEVQDGKPSRYILSMFPYPSGRLHLGHVRIYTSGDILARYSRLMSKNAAYSEKFTHVVHPMGFDSFGLPADNAARERGLDPSVWTNSNIRTMKQQLDDLALQLEWRESTSNPTYYRWTQSLFLRLFKAGLAYKSYSQVNWDPIDKTVLADEQVDSEGHSWRSGAKVEKRFLKQWFLKTNAFTAALYKSEEIDLKSWRDVVSIQRHWIGKPSGWMFYLPFKSESSREVDIVTIFTKTPELFLDERAFFKISPDHWLESVYRVSQTNSLRNPFTGRDLRIELTENIDELPTNCKATLETISVDPQDESKRTQVLEDASRLGLGGYFTSDKYRDWVVSRQRFWGTPIPIINCKNCGHRTVPEESLPVKVPKIDLSRSIGSNKSDAVSSLAEYAPSDWINCDCPNCGSPAKRECDTLDTLYDSSWYFLRYASQPTHDVPFNPERVQPVWCYIGGIEHAAMHIFYARFMTHFLNSQGMIKFKEPFSKLLVQGVIKSRTYKHNNRYIGPEEAKSIAKDQLEVCFEKMSKSKGNGVDPQNLLENYGVDATRLCLMSYANPRSERLWRDECEEYREVLIFLQKVVKVIEAYVDAGDALKNKSKTINIENLDPEALTKVTMDIVRIRNKCCSKAIYEMETAMQFRQFISVLHVMLAALRSNLKTSAIYSQEYAELLASFIIMLNPITPHVSEELWSQFGKSLINPLKNIENPRFNVMIQACDQPWPIPDNT